MNGTILTANDLNAYNYVGNETEVVPVPLVLDDTVAKAATNATNGTGYAWTWDVPWFSITVLQFDI